MAEKRFNFLNFFNFCVVKEKMEEHIDIFLNGFWKILSRKATEK